ncbi:hypothetical protein L6164_012076 [Bauhinia variegata]|uniref:Uncharacterized protein n=1 Tax=Bauhinia variegata TaxID=167791 RepID=A0ACB9P7V7_BAUVA|nr:hypothetical protein L6164_012076 [Bauhinia variegata]
MIMGGVVRFVFAVAVAGAFMAFPATAGGGSWQLLQQNIGIVAMHMQLLKNDRVVIFDRTDFGYSNLTLPNGRCRFNSREKRVKTDCTAHSVEYDVASNSIRALFVQTDVWCSSGAVAPNGTLFQTGGFNDGERVVRAFNACPTCDWQELGEGLAFKRWYSTNHILPDGRQIVIGGRDQFDYEFVPKTGAGETACRLPFLWETTDHRALNNLYPFVFLNVDGNLFIFANNRSILFDYQSNKVVRTYPDIPGGDPRCYPSTGSAVLLPLNLQANTIEFGTENKTQSFALEAEVLVCGGAPRGSWEKARYKGQFLPALDTCGRIKITDPNPQWVMETMPVRRTMGDMIILPNGDILIINGAASGAGGWEYGRDPVLNPVLYKTNNPNGSRFELQNPSDIPRMYHSGAILLRDGRVLVGGSNAHEYYEFQNVLFPTELRLEAFSPSYLEPRLSHLRPNIISPVSQLQYNRQFLLRFQVTTPKLYQRLLSVTLLAPPFNTHSFSMSQRLLVLPMSKLIPLQQNSTYQVEVTTPKSAIIAPPGSYILFVVHQTVPSEGIWVQLLKSDSQHLEHLKLVFQVLRKQKFYANLKKCQFFSSYIVFLGYIVTSIGITVDSSKIEAIASWPIPKSIYDVRSFHGLVSFYCKFIK